MTIRPALVLPLLAALFLPLAACDDGGSSEPGTAIVSWSLEGTATCDTLHIDTVEARAVNSLDDGEVVASESIACPSDTQSGSITMADAPAGRYFIEVEGFNEEGRGTHYGAADSKVRIPSGGVIDVEAEQGKKIKLVQKPVDLIVDWDLGHKCSSVGVEEVQVLLLDATGTPISGIESTAPCDNEVEHPVTGAMVAGVLFEALAPRADVKAFVEAMNADGGVVMEGESDTFDLLAGDVHSEIVEMEDVE
ncbi:MAG: hypothetical protein ACQEXJ_01100 [Myxococcota bacterium]